MSSIDQLMGACASAMKHGSWEVHKYLIYLQEKQLLRFAKDVKDIKVETLAAWGIPMRLGLEMKYQSGILSKKPILQYAVNHWLSKRGRRKDFDEWSVSSDDLRLSSFRLEPTAHTRAKDFISGHIQPLLWKFRLRLKARFDENCEVSQWIKTIAQILDRPDMASTWKRFLVIENWIRTVQDVKLISETTWQKWSIEDKIPFKISILLRKLESITVPFKYPILPLTVKRSTGSKSKLDILPKRTSSTNAANSEKSPASQVVNSVFVSSLRTLQDKLLEFTAQVKEEEPSWLLRNFKATVEISGLTVVLVFNSRQSRWFLDAKTMSGDIYVSVNLLKVSKVARVKEDTHLLIKHKEKHGEINDLIIECGNDCAKISKVVRKIINWNREGSVL